jgi:molybdopterin synthase sulfur carrier subunit
MATIRLAPVLRPSVGGSKQVTAEGSNLNEVLADLYKRYPGLKEQIQPEGGLSRFVNVYINDQDVRYLQGLETHVGPTDVIQLLPAMAGGQERKSLRE